MNFGVLGTGIVGRTVGGKLVALGHEVMIGTRDVARTVAVTQPDRMGTPPLSVWLKENPKMRLGTFTQAAAHGEILVNATAGTGSLEALRQAGETNLKAQAAGILRSFGWKDILDLGDIATARGPEMYLPLWLRLWGALQTPMYNVKVVR